MTLVVAAFGSGWVAAAADRGFTRVLDDTGEVIERGFYAESKIIVTDGYPMILATAGPGYGFDIARAYVAGKTFTMETGAYHTASSLWPQMYEYHGQRFGACEPARAGMTLLVAAVDPIGMPRVYGCEYPNKEPQSLHAVMFGDQFVGMGTGIVAHGVHNANWKVRFGRTDAAGGVASLRAVLDAMLTIERIRAEAGEQDVIQPFMDMVLLQKDRAEVVEVAQPERSSDSA